MTDFISKLHDETTFYQAFTNDLNHASKEVVIEIPFITSEGTRTLKRAFEKLAKRGVKIYIFTRDPKQHSDGNEVQSEEEIRYFEVRGTSCTVRL